MTKLLVNADTFINEFVPGQVNGSAGNLVVNGASGQRKYSLLHVAVPDLIGSTVTSAKLGLTLRSDGWRAGNQIKVDLLTQSFTEQSTWSGYHTKLPTLPTAHQVVFTVTAAAGGTYIQIDVTQLMVDAARSSAFYGFLISTPATTVNHWFFSSEAVAPAQRPYLDITYAQTPPAPTNLVPAEGASAAKPKFAWTQTNQVAFNVQISATQNGSFPDFDTGWVSSTDSGWDSSSSSWTTNVPANGEATSWRVRTQNTAGVTSSWSAWTTYTRHNYGNLSITNPAVNGAFVDANTPEVAWTLGGATQSAWEVLILTYDSGRTPGTDTALQLPGGLIVSPGVTYSVEVRVWDDQVRDAPGELGYVAATRTFLFDNSGSPTAPVATLTASQDGPAIVLRWTRSSEPDTFVIIANGSAVTEIDPVDASIGDGTTYQVRYLSAQPLISIQWEVRAHDDATGDSHSNPTATSILKPIGVWIAYAPLDIEVQLAGQENVDMTIVEDGATFLPLGRRAPIRVVDQIRGYAGTIQGTIQSVVDLEKFNAIKALDPSTTDIRLIYGSYNFPIELGDTTVSQWPTPSGGDAAYEVTAEFWQIGPPWPSDETSHGWGEFAWGETQWR